MVTVTTKCCNWLSTIAVVSIKMANTLDLHVVELVEAYLWKAELCIAPSLMRRVKEKVPKFKIDDTLIMTCKVLN